MRFVDVVSSDLHSESLTFAQWSFSWLQQPLRDAAPSLWWPQIFCRFPPHQVTASLAAHEVTPEKKALGTS